MNERRPPGCDQRWLDGEHHNWTTIALSGYIYSYSLFWWNCLQAVFQCLLFITQLTTECMYSVHLSIHWKPYYDTLLERHRSSTLQLWVHGTLKKCISQVSIAQMYSCFTALNYKRGDASSIKYPLRSQVTLHLLPISPLEDISGNKQFWEAYFSHWLIRKHQLA